MCIPCYFPLCTFHFYRCTATVTGRNCSPIDVPPGPVPTPLAVNWDVPGAMASKTTAANNPVPDAPVASAERVIVMSMRPGAASCVNVAFAPPSRMKLPSCTLRTRSTAGSYVIVRLIVVNRAAPTIDSGTVYGPCPIRNVPPGGEITTCAEPTGAPALGGSGTVGAAD
jgi:hypothetical protein